MDNSIRVDLWTRRHLLLVAAASVVTAGRVAAQPAHVALTSAAVDVGGRPVPVTRYSIVSDSKRPAVLLLHGSRGLDARLPAYDRYARDLAAAGIDAWLFSYYAPGEMASIEAAGSSAQREALYARFAVGWVSLVRAVAADTLQSGSGKVGLLGFSLGGFVSVAAASQPLFSALAVCYAGAPTFYHRPLGSLPPLLALHGDADRAVPLKSGTALVTKAKGLGGPAELHVYRGRGHGFDLDLTNPDAAAARERVVGFMKHWLAAST